MTKQSQQSFLYPFWAAEIIAKRTSNFRPKIAIILGSGLGKVSQQLQNTVVIPYDELPNFSVSKIEGHSGKLHLGTLKGVPVVCLEGRTHSYEGENSLDVISTVVRTLKLIGCEMLFATSAVGSLNQESGPGSLVLIKDHINFMFSNVLIGPNHEKFGERFTSMDNVYDSSLRAKMLKVANRLNIPITEGVFIASSGPTFETHAEIRAFKILGADIVGMSQVPEVSVARHCGMKVVSIGAVVNLAAGLTDEILSHEGTLRGAALAVEKLANLILSSVEELVN